MSFHREIIATPEGLEAELAGLDDSDLRRDEVAQLQAIIAAIPALAPHVSKREPMLITLTGHTDPDGGGFDARNLAISISRIEPEDAQRRRTEAEQALEEAVAAEEAAAETRKRAELAAERAKAEAGGSAGETPAA